MAQNISGTNLYNNWKAAIATPVCRVRCDWNRDGDYNDTYENVSSRVLNIQITHEIYQSYTGLPRMGERAIGEAQLILSNEDNWFSPGNTSGLVATYPGLANGIYRIPIKIEIGYREGSTDELLTQFVGEITSANESERGGARTVTFRCEDNGFPLSQYKYNSALLEEYRTDQVIAQYLSDAGIATTDLDTGMFIIPWAYTETENLLEELGRVAASEGGFFFFSKEGVPTFRRATALLEQSDSLTAQANIDSGDIFEYSDEYSWRDAYSGVRIEWTGFYKGALVEVYRLANPISIAPGKTETIRAILRWPCTDYILPVLGTDYQVITAGGEPSEEFTLSVDSESAKEIVFSITNNLAAHSLYVTDFVVRGYPLLSEEEEAIEEETGLSLVPGVKIFAVRSNPYIQTREQAGVLASYLRDWFQRPHRIYNWTGPGCPWLELLDRVHLSHNTMDANPGIDTDCYVLSNTQTFTGSGYTQSLILLPVTDLYHYDDYFLLGTSTYADTGSDKLGY